MHTRPYTAVEFIHFIQQVKFQRTPRILQLLVSRHAALVTDVLEFRSQSCRSLRGSTLEDFPPKVDHWSYGATLLSAKLREHFPRGGFTYFGNIFAIVSRVYVSAYHGIKYTTIRSERLQFRPLVWIRYVQEVINFPHLLSIPFHATWHCQAVLFSLLTIAFSPRRRALAPVNLI